MVEVAEDNAALGQLELSAREVDVWYSGARRDHEAVRKVDHGFGAGGGARISQVGMVGDQIVDKITSGSDRIAEKVDSYSCRATVP